VVNKPAKVQRRRLDQAMVERGLAESRARAQALILAQDVLVNGATVSKAGAPVAPDDEIVLKAPPRFVSRGGEKLDHALTAFEVDVSGKVAADFGASTGGFTDALLQRGARRVYAIDVGYGQLAEKLRLDPRVVVMDRQNVRVVTALPEPVEIVSIDVSFIGLHLVLPAAKAILASTGEIVALVKPQFEAGRADVGKGGVVRDPAIHQRVLREVIAVADALELGVYGVTASPLLGPAGNREFLIHLKPGAAGIDAEQAIDAAMFAGVDRDP
jgi:23S rRNA (cytidine1920-2'-O)/16S rRNA (cytidine1409-2'-O)-methyltransferase